MASTGGFWTTTGLADPKRKFRFLVTMGSMPQGATWYAKSVTKPQVTVAAEKHQFLNHTFYYPGSVTWNEVSIMLVDPVSPDASANLSRILFEAGYQPPRNANDVTTISKSRAVAALQSVTIEQINSDGEPVETWRLNNAFITDVNYGGDLKYGDDTLADLTVKMRYDWADLFSAIGAEPGPLGTPASTRFWHAGGSTA